MKKPTLSLLFLSFCFLAVGQDTIEDYFQPAKKGLPVKDRVSISFMAGTTVCFPTNKYSSVSTFFAPKMNYQFSSKFQINAGLMHISSSPNFILSNENYGKNQKNYSSNLLFVGGEYQLNKKVIVSGAVITNTSSSYNKPNNYKAATVGLDYKISKHSSIGIRATVSQGNPDYIFNPNQGSYNYNPFIYNSVGNIFTGMGQWGADELNNRSIR